MPFDSNGTFNRLRSWASDAAANILIRSDYHDAHDQDLAAGLSTVITKDGRTQPTANLPLNNHRLINVQDPVAPQDVATKNYVDRLQTFTTSINISGADQNGYVSFTAPTGANGLSFTGADLSWLAKIATAAGPGTPPNPPATLNRLVLNTAKDGSGTDVVTVNDDGSMKATSLDTTSNITAGGSITGTSVVYAKATTGNVHFWFLGPNNERRGILYTNAAAMGSVLLDVNGAQTYTFDGSGNFFAPAAVFAGTTARLSTDGNVYGSVYGNQWLTTWASNMATGQAQYWANDRVNNLQFRRTGQASSGGNSNWECPAGCCVTGYQRDVGGNGQVYWLYYRQLQFYSSGDGQWRNFHD
jgi:hypothetical protein